MQASEATPETSRAVTHGRTTNLPRRPRGPAGRTTSAKRGHGGWPSFHEILSALNPLQYLPVVGTIYRAVTGDTVPEGVRLAGSMAVSALTGGPLGVLINAATTVLEKVTGIDPEAIATEVADSLGLGPHAAPAAASQRQGAPLAPPEPDPAERLAAFERYSQVALT